MSNSQYKELLEFLITQFDKIDQRFESIDQRFESIDRHFISINERFESNDQSFKSLEARVSNLENNQDRFLKELLEFRQEFTVSSFRISRIEEWVTKAAQKIDLPYNP